jgi:hypothetical protein
VESISVLIIVLLVLVAVFLIIRMFWLWYWKVNVVVRLLTEIRDGQQLLAQHLAVQSTVAQSLPPEAPTAPANTRITSQQSVVLRAEPTGTADVIGSVAPGTMTVIRKAALRRGCHRPASRQPAHLPLGKR